MFVFLSRALATVGRSDTLRRRGQLASAQNHPSGIPQFFIDEKQREVDAARAAKVEQERLAVEATEYARRMMQANLAGGKGHNGHGHATVRLFTSNTRFSLNLRLDPGKYVLFIGCEG